jgi:Fe-S-cluster-containing dehydrogenase component
MKKWHMIVDVARCEDCNNCSLACKDEHVGNEWPGYAAAQPLHGQRWMNVARMERGEHPLVDVAYRPTTCMHCAEAPCVDASDGTIQKRKDGIVLIDPVKAKGRRDLVDTCPYRMIWWNEEKQLAQKCTFCAHLLDKDWKQPRCVQACPTGALRVEYVEDAEMARIAVTEKLQSLHPEHGTRPSLFYANLQRFDTVFIAGSVSFTRDQRVDCAAGTFVVLYQNDKRIAETKSDAFGDFKFDGLAPKSTGYRVELSLPGYGKRTLTVNRLEKSVNLGAIDLCDPSAKIHAVSV